MRILLLAPHSFYIDRGSPIDVDLLIRALSLRGDMVDLVVYRGGEDRAYPGVTIHRATTPAWLANIGPGLSLRKALADLWLFAKARELVSHHHYDVVHAGEESVFLALWFHLHRGLPYVYDMDSSIAQQIIEKIPWLRPLSWFFNCCETRAIRSAVAAAPVCSALADHARRRGASHVETLHSISQLTPGDFVRRNALREKLGLKNLVLMYVGNLERYQGIGLLLEAFAQVPTNEVALDLVVAGGTPAAIRHYEKKARRLGIGRRTHFIGPWPSAALGELLGEADILVSPRIKGINTPLKVFPYLHSGRVVLATNLPTHTQILNTSFCELAPPNPESFAAAIVRLARDQDRRRRLGQAGHRFVESNHILPAYIRRVHNLYICVEHALRAAVPVAADSAPRPLITH